MKYALAIFALLLTLLPLQGQIGRLPLSPLQTINQRVGITDLNIVYSRPAMRGRVIFGGLIPYGSMWRTGANRNTKVSFSETVFVGDDTLEAGEYALFTKPGRDTWEIYFYTDTDNWNVPDNIEEAKIAAYTKVPASRLERVVQSLTLNWDAISNDKVKLSIRWENTYVAIPIRLSTEALMAEKIEDVLNGPNEDDYFLAAQYRWESGRGLEQALIWIDKAIELRGTATYYEYRIKSEIEYALGYKEKAIKSAKIGLQAAKDWPSEFGIRVNTANLKKWGAME